MFVIILKLQPEHFHEDNGAKNRKNVPFTRF
jgi:hypothetical protein